MYSPAKCIEKVNSACSRLGSFAKDPSYQRLEKSPYPWRTARKWRSSSQAADYQYLESIKNRAILKICYKFSRIFVGLPILDCLPISPYQQ